MLSEMYFKLDAEDDRNDTSKAYKMDYFKRSTIYFPDPWRILNING